MDQAILPISEHGGEPAPRLAENNAGQRKYTWHTMCAGSNSDGSVQSFHVVAFRPGDILKRLVRKNLGKKAQKKRLSSTRLPVISKSL